MILEVRNLTKKYGRSTILNNISFTLDAGQIIALVGPNGSGKSTLLDILANLVPSNAGSVKICGKNHSDSAIFREVSYMQDNSVLYDYLTGYDHLQFICRIQQLPKERVIEAAKQIGNDAYLYKKVKHYSLGMKQHLLLAMAVINQPKLLILDEPLNGLDPTSAIRVRHLLRQFKDEGMTILLSSHHLSEIDQITSDVLFLKDGHLLKETLSSDEKYLLHTSDNDRAYSILIEQRYRVATSEQQLLITMEHHIIDDLFILLQQNHIRILQIEKSHLGTEERYKAIFEGGGL